MSITPLGFPQVVFENYLESEEEINQAYYGGELTEERYQDILDLYFDRIDPEAEELSSGETSKIARGSSYIFVKVNRADLLWLINTVYIQPALDNWEDFRILDEAELWVGITKNLALTTALSYNYDSEPPGGIKHHDLEIKNGLKFSFFSR
jgi:hypothetical protein